MADVVAIEEAFGIGDGDVLPCDGDGDGLLDDIGDLDGELLPLDDEEQSESGAFLSNFDLSLSPTTLSQSIDLFKSRITLALIWKDPEAKPSWIVCTEIDTLPNIRSLFPQKENF